MKAFVMILVCVLFGVCGQLSLKHGMTKVGVVTLDFPTLFGSFLKTFTNPFVLTGLLFYGMSTLIWLVILSQVELSFAYPLISMGYIFVVFLSWLIFKEEVTLIRIAGTLVICLGVWLVSQS